MDLIYFLAGIAVTSLISLFFFKQKAKESAIKEQPNDSRSSKTDEDQLEVLLGALDCLPIGVVIADTKGGSRLQNKAASEMTGIRYVDVLIDEAVDEMIEDVKKSVTGERILEAVAGTTRFFKLRGQEMTRNRIIVTIEDVTKISRVDTVQTDFVANLSHELKTPIGAVAALADSLNGETVTEVVWRLAERIVTESHRMSRIVDDLLDLSRLEFGGTDDWSEVDLGQVLIEVVGSNQHAAKRQGLGLSLNGSVEAVVRGDRAQLVSVFSNLVDNAIKYSEKGGLVTVGSEIKNDDVLISVKDHGIGIAQRDQRRIFERFYRVDKARSRATGGTGLGLSIVRHIVLEHGGEISVESEEGVGSNFLVRLPRIKRVSPVSVVNESEVLA